MLIWQFQCSADIGHKPADPGSRPKVTFGLSNKHRQHNARQRSHHGYRTQSPALVRTSPLSAPAFKVWFHNLFLTTLTPDSLSIHRCLGVFYWSFTQAKLQTLEKQLLFSQISFNLWKRENKLLVWFSRLHYDLDFVMIHYADDALLLL